jgi:hypothetical protein
MPEHAVADVPSLCLEAADGDPLLAVELAARLVAGHFASSPPADWGHPAAPDGRRCEPRQVRHLSHLEGLLTAATARS